MPNIELNLSKDLFLPNFLPYIEDYSCRYNVYWGGRASGKTKFITQKLVLKGLKEKRLILLMRKETNKLKDSVWKELLIVLEEWKLMPYFTLNKTEFRATCNINGTEFKCLGLDEPEKIKGFADMSDVFMDEITAFTADDVELIDGTLRSAKYGLPLQIYFSFNPVSKQNFVYKFFGFDTGNVPPNTFINHSTYLTNVFLEPSYKERMIQLKERNPIRYKIEAEGQFATLDKLIYYNWEVSDEEIDTSKMEMMLSLDWGYTNDPTAFIVAFRDEDNKTIYIVDEYVQKGMTNEDIANMIKYKGFAKSLIMCDSAEPKSVAELNKHGIIRAKSAVKGRDSVRQGIAKLQEYKLVIKPQCENTIIELENYAWKKDKQTGEYTNEPIDAFNHCLDSLRYGLQCVDNTHKLQTVSKATLGI